MRNAVLHVLASILILIFAYPEPVLANMGTPLMWLAWAHLYIGNAVIGLAEAVVLALLFRTRWIRSIFLMVAANFASMMVGWLAIEWSKGFLAAAITIYNVRVTLELLTCAFFVVTTMIEWPFCYWSFPKKRGRGWLSLGASGCVNVLSYAVLIYLYLSVSNTSLLTHTSPAEASSILKRNDLIIYFLSSDGHSLNMVDVKGHDERRIVDVGSEMKRPLLYVCDAGERMDLRVMWDDPNDMSAKRKSAALVNGLSGKTAVSQPCASVEQRFRGEVTDFRTDQERNWIIRGWPYAIEGLTADSKSGGQRISLALETPFINWPVTNVTILPGDQVICQLGDQIVVVDLETRRIGLITRGISPVVICNDQPGTNSNKE
jgi:hypothetical protein